ncbi:pilus assembly protein TadB [Klenkia sp. LSe6-5]|uniref:Pilus assembly protein TadB n=1 Tax=Klenkia sesuvii TaxID=3103137 RepID=A0ABU8DV76_9ACTN
MSGALLCLAAAVLCWPPVTVLARLRVPARPARGEVTVPAALAVAVGGVGAVVSTPVVGALAGTVTALALRAWRARQRALDGQAQVRALAEALGVLAAELRAGRPLAAATGTAVASCPHPGAARALRPVLAGAAVPGGAAPGGAEPGGAVKGGARQVRGPGGPAGELAGELPAEARTALDRVVTAAAVSARTGCSLAAVVTVAEDDLRARLRTRAELGAALSGPRASATVLAGLPVLGLAMGAGIGADPWSVLTTTPVGTVLLVVGVGLEAAGLLWSGRLAERAARS